MGKIIFFTTKAMSKFRSPLEHEAKTLQEFHARGLSAYSVRRALRISPRILQFWLAELNLSPLKINEVRRTKPLATNEAADFRKYYATMPTQREVLACYNISIKTFNAWLQQLNLEKHPPKARTQSTTQRFDSLPRSRTYPKKNPAYAIVITPSQNSFSDIDEDGDRQSLAARFRCTGQVALDPYR